MKKISALVILLFLALASFSQNDKILANNREVYRALQTGDVSNLKNYIAADAIDHEGGANGQDVVGADSIIAMIGSMHNSFTNLKMDIVAEAVNGDYVFTLVHMTGTTTANPGMGMPPNKAIDSKSVDVVKLKNGMAVEHWEFLDPKEMMAMMGTGK